jgi:hypothetical protein
MKYNAKRNGCATYVAVHPYAVRKLGYGELGDEYRMAVKEW